MVWFSWLAGLCGSWNLSLCLSSQVVMVWEWVVVYWSDGRTREPVPPGGHSTPKNLVRQWPYLEPIYSIVSHTDQVCWAPWPSPAVCWRKSCIVWECRWGSPDQRQPALLHQPWMEHQEKLYIGLLYRGNVITQWVLWGLRGWLTWSCCWTDSLQIASNAYSFFKVW